MKHLDNENIVFCDNHILVIDKPAGIATQPDLERLAKEWVKDRFQKKGNVFLQPVHRLDKPVSGLVLFARTSKALSRLNTMMREKKIHKTYYARIEGSPPQIEGTLKHHLVHGEFKAHVSEKGKEAVLHYRVLKNGVLEITLETGRYHQIRTQLSAIGCPIIGDKKYGSKKSFPEGIALHAGKLEFIHPVTNEKIQLSRMPRTASSAQAFLPT